MKIKTKINQLAYLNKESYSKNNMPDVIEYIDIKSLTENILSNIQILKTGIDSIPSRARRKITDNTIIYSSVRPRNNHYCFFESPHDNMVASTGYITINAIEEKIDPYYLYCILTLPKNLEYIYKLADSAVSSYPSITPDDLGNMEVEIEEDIEEQKKIAKLFYTVDKLIFNNNKINKKSYNICSNIYNYYFNNYKCQNTSLKYDEKLKIKIPNNWNVDLIKNQIYEVKSGDWGSDNYSDELIEASCIRGADFESVLSKNNSIPLRYINECSFSEKRVLSGDLLVEISGGSPTQSTGRICYINNYTLKRFNNNLISSNFCKVISLNDKDNYIWFYFLWQSMYDSGVFFNFEGKTSGLKNLLFDDIINNVYIPIPSDKILNDFNSKMKPIFDNIQRNINFNYHLRELKEKYYYMFLN